MLKILSEASEAIGQAAATKVYQELSKFAAIDKVSFQGSIALVECPAFSEASQLVNRAIEVASIAQKYWFDRILLSWPQCANPLQISANFARSDRSNPDFLIPKLELTFPDFLINEKPIYINSFKTLQVLFANEAALQCQQRSPSSFFGQSVYELNYAEELDRRIERIRRGDVLTEYNYKAFRWCGESTKKVMNFSTNFGLVEFAGEVCWYSAPQEAIETRELVSAS